MHTRSVMALIAGCALSLVSASSIACGESLFRVGKGVSFREYTAPLPGSIVVVARTEAELALVAQLATAGHEVHVVAESAQISSMLEQHDIDIVLAYFSEREAVAAQINDRAVAYIPVTSTEDVDAAGQLYDQTLSSNDSVKTFLKTIHRTLKARA